VAATIHGGPINGPWDMTALDRGSMASLFVTNVLNGTVAANGKIVDRGTVVRIDLRTSGDEPSVTSETVIGWGFPERTDPAALVIGPTGVALGDNGTLYVADTLDNRIAAISDALDRTTASHKGKTVSMNGSLNMPLGLAVAPNDNIVAVNAADGNGVEVTPSGHQIVTRMLDAAGGGSLFGLAVAPGGKGLYFVADDSNTLQLLR
jgi:DNA-binding beta-propeller fold protein YncE